VNNDAPALDLDGESREALELDAVLAYAASFASSAPGRLLLLETPPLSDLPALRSEHAAVAEARAYVARVGRLLAGRLPDPGPAERVLAVEGLPVEAAALRDLASCLLAAADLAKRLAGLSEAGLVHLAALGRGIPDLSAAASPIARGIGADGRLEDDASKALGRIRQAIGVTGDRLRRQLESFVHDPAVASVVRDDFVTQGGRFVVPVRTDAPRPVEGIVHAASSSGQTLFVEPLESVPLNNELVRLAEEEALETERILAGWAGRLRELGTEVARALSGLARADVLQARALFGEAIGGVTPQLEEGGPFRLDAVRHPLLDRRLKEKGSGCVPIALSIEPHDRVLVLSGPNTGGKTVALKTAGLAVLMAQSGLPVAAAAMESPVFRRVRADIGDHQSIDADLSTFSAHVRAVDRFLRDPVLPSLYLFDEIGTGTEPSEGSALARALLERMQERRITTIATTHLGALKTWAFATPEVASAALEFDAATLRPTYRVLAGVAGASAGLDVAERLGLDPAIVARARSLLGTGAVNTESAMGRLRELTVEVASQAEVLAAERDALALERTRLEERAREDTARRQEQARRALEEAMKAFQDEVRKELAGIQDAKERARVERAHARAATRLTSSLTRAKGSVGPARAPAAAPAAIEAGARVRIVSLDRDGDVLSVQGERVEVRMGGVTFTVARGDLAAGAAAPAAAPPTARGPAQAESASPPLELLLIGKRVEEALAEIDKFLDQTAREGRTEVRVVHGHGTGRLREGVRRHLRGHPQVASFRPGGAGEGGDGATVVTLR
jgi:DNA mismatch repair protein MutS2